MARVPLPESKLRARRRRRRLFVLMFVFILCVLAVGGLALLARASFLKITTVSVAGVETLATSTLQSFVKEKMSGYYAYLFPKDDIFLYPRSGLAAAVLSAYPTLKSAEVQAQDFHHIEVTVVERQPKALWCPLDASEAEGACYFMDEEGVVYAPAPEFSAPVYISYRGPVAGLPAQAGDALPKHYLSPPEFQSLSALADALAHKVPTETLQSVSVDDHRDTRVRFINREALHFDLLFSLDDEAGDVFERFELALTAKPFVSRSLYDFEYLDLRFGDKLYYKLK